MSELQKRFEQASQDVQTLSSRPDNNTLLDLYALFKQASTGDVTGSRPGFTDFKGRAKYDAWQKLQGTAEEVAMERYVALVDRLKRA